MELEPCFPWLYYLCILPIVYRVEPHYLEHSSFSILSSDSKSSSFPHSHLATLKRVISVWTLPKLMTFIHPCLISQHLMTLYFLLVKHFSFWFPNFIIDSISQWTLLSLFVWLLLFSQSSAPSSTFYLVISIRPEIISIQTNFYAHTLIFIYTCMCFPSVPQTKWLLTCHLSVIYT